MTRFCMLLRILLCSAYTSDVNIYAQFEGLASVKGQVQLEIPMRIDQRLVGKLEVFANRQASTDTLQPMSIGAIKGAGANLRLLIKVDLSVPARLVFVTELHEGETLLASLSLAKKLDGQIKASVLDLEVGSWRKREGRQPKRKGTKFVQESQLAKEALQLEIDHGTVIVRLRIDARKASVLAGGRPRASKIAAPER